jgi:hypothetical protein
LLMPSVLRLGAGPAIRRADRTVTGWTASGSYEVTSRPIAGRRPAGRHVGTMTRGQSSWGSDPPNDVNTLTVKLSAGRVASRNFLSRFQMKLARWELRAVLSQAGSYQILFSTRSG